MSVTKKRKKSRFRCAVCRRYLPQERWVYSSHTGNRFCYPGEGCQKPKKEAS
jgi:hypothetical protein